MKDPCISASKRGHSFIHNLLPTQPPFLESYWHSRLEIERSPIATLSSNAAVVKQACIPLSASASLSPSDSNFSNFRTWKIAISTRKSAENSFFQRFWLHAMSCFPGWISYFSLILGRTRQIHKHFMSASSLDISSWYWIQLQIQP